MPPTQDEWFNYGGDKLWLLPEGNDDEQHWRGNSDLLDDGPFTFRKLSEGEGCGDRTHGPPDPQTGIQFSRTIRLDSDSPHIAFHASMKNVSGHTVEWSMQSVSQYNTGDAQPDPCTRAIAIFGHLLRRTVQWISKSLSRSLRPGGESLRRAVRDDGLFALHYCTPGCRVLGGFDRWLAGRGRWQQPIRHGRALSISKNKPYPGKASVIFWTNGPELRLSKDGVPSVSDGPDGSLPFTWKPRSIARCAVCAREKPANSKQNGFRREPRANFME